MCEKLFSNPSDVPVIPLNTMCSSDYGPPCLDLLDRYHYQSEIMPGYEGSLSRNKPQGVSFTFSRQTWTVCQSPVRTEFAAGSGAKSDSSSFGRIQNQVSLFILH